MAGNRIRGITVEIGGDTTKLQTALKGVNTEIRNTQSQLKDVEKLLKLDPGNTELIAQKHRLLAQAVSETREKLETLKTAQQQADEALRNGTISQDQYDALQREIVETEQRLRSLEEQANQSATALQKIRATGEKLQTVGNKISSVGQKLLPVTGVMTGLGTAAVKTAADFDSAMSRVAAVSGATGSDFDSLRDKAREMGAKTKFSATEAADAMNYMAMAGWKTEDMLSGIEGVMYLAAASGEDLATTSDIVTDALTAFGLTAAEAGKVLADCYRHKPLCGHIAQPAFQPLNVRQWAGDGLPKGVAACCGHGRQAPFPTGRRGQKRPAPPRPRFAGRAAAGYTRLYRRLCLRG